jgi:ubiquinone/menaquinone biosynthesis C-methylase UbiE
MKNNKEIKVNWNKYAEQYDAITMSGANPSYEELVNIVFKSFGYGVIKKDSLILDIGGGTGNFTMPLAKFYPDSKFVIADTSEKMLEIAKKKAEKNKLKNVDCILEDAENINKIVETYSRPITHAFMIHSLYTTGGINDEKPRRILKNINDYLENYNSQFLISDINRQINTNDWIPYCLKNKFFSYRKEGKGKINSIIKTAQFFKENDQSKLANKFIDYHQQKGEYIICSLEQFVGIIKESGMDQIHKQSDAYYRGRDNFIVTSKK